MRPLERGARRVTLELMALRRENPLRRVLRIGALTLVAGVIAALLVSGCGQSQKQDGAGTGGRAFQATDIPTRKGSSKAFFSNDPSVNPFVAVNFGFKGPWDFREGPIDSLVVSEVMSTRTAVQKKFFPKAGIAIATVIKGKESLGTVAYFTKTKAAYIGYGQANSKAANVFPKPETILKLPLRVGDRWSDRIALRSTPPKQLEIDRKVVGQGTVNVPAGTFNDALMIQIKKRLIESDGTSTGSIGYEWYAPKVGIVAWIAGRNDEPGPLFKEAAFFQRLRSQRK